MKSLVCKDFCLEKKHAVHIIPFILASLYFTLIYHVQSIETKIEILSVSREYSSINQVIFVGILHILIAGYMFAYVRTLLRYRPNLKQHYSNLEEVSLSWLNIVLFGFILFWIMDVVIFVLANSGISSLFLSSTSLVFIFIFSNIIVYEGLRQPEIFSGIEEKHKYQKYPLTKEEKEKIYNQL